MNLRQKVKQAKKRLAMLEKQSPYTQWDMVVNFQAKNEMQKIIDFKRKPSRYFHWNETYEINLDNLTYIAIYADSEKLAEMKNTNGKPLKKEQVSAFVDSVLKNQFYHYAAKVSEMEKHPKNEKINDPRYEQRINTVDYSLKLSNDRTKQKRFHREVFYQQMRGSDQLFKPNK